MIHSICLICPYNFKLLRWIEPHYYMKSFQEQALKNKHCWDPGAVFRQVVLFPDVNWVKCYASFYLYTVCPSVLQLAVLCFIGVWKDDEVKEVGLASFSAAPLSSLWTSNSPCLLFPAGLWYLVWQQRICRFAELLHALPTVRLSLSGKTGRNEDAETHEYENPNQQGRPKLVSSRNSSRHW